MAEEDEKIQLFESEEEVGEEENFDGDFKIRPEYQGPYGLQMLELNSELSARFKLDKRFVEDFDPNDFKEVKEESKATESNEEKEKNIKILESLLGHEVSKPLKPVDKRFTKKQLIRFDPEDENASQFVKTPDNLKEKPKKSKKIKENVEEKSEEVIPISSERYIEVDPNLKDILSSSTSFSFSKKFNFEHSETDVQTINDTVEPVFEIKIPDIVEPPRCKTPVEKSDNFTFFITEDDPRLKIGIQFFKRPKPLEEIRVEWQKRRERVLELFKRKRSSLRSRTTKVQSVQMKNMIRRNNFKR